MIPKGVRPGATGENLGDGETRAFTISANGTAFRTLIDGLYSNKIQAVVRELCSNAWDSHIAQGHQRPIKVSIPTSLDPTFRVRDFGTSLSHDEMMDLYTTIFQSSKTGTNDQTGQLGLGSKSPFAYTDSFFINAWLDGVKRSYLAFLATDGVPSLKYMGSEASDEERGLEVLFAAKREDINQFQREMQFVSMGYKITPEVEGMRVRLSPPRLSGTNWAMYPRGAFGDEIASYHYIRQGSAIYPTNRSFPNVGHGWITITDIPIGTAAVTASREALSYDDETREAIENVQQGAYEELKAQIDVFVAAAKTRVEKAKVYLQYNGILTNMRGKSDVTLWADESRARTGERDGDLLANAAHYGKSANARGVSRRYSSQFEVDELDTFKLLVNDLETKVVRRQTRIRSIRNGWVLDLPETAWEMDGVTGKRKIGAKKLHPRAAGIAWVKECLSLRDDQIIMVSSIPDIPPVRKPSAGPKKPPRILAPGQFWMSRQEGRMISGIYGVSDRGVGEWPTRMRKAANAAGMKVKWEDIFFVTERQEETFTKRKQLPANMKLDTAIEKELTKQVAKAPLDAAQTYDVIVQMVGSYNKALPVVLANFFPELKIDATRSQEILAMADLAKIDLRNRPIAATINAKVRELIAQYPLLFQKSDRSHFEHYVAAVQAAEKAEVTK